MKFCYTALLAAVLSGSLVSSHATFQYINDQQGPIRIPPNNNPVMDVSSRDIACNVNGDRPASQVLSVAAGSSVTLEWHHDANNRNSQAIDPSHKGPTIAYLAKVANAATASASGLGWFKIFQDGMTGDTWGVDRLIANKGKYTVRIPSNIQSGDYLLRSEVIALHASGTYPGAQFYMGCAQIRVTGGGNASPATVSFPGAYRGSDPGITINIYYPKPASYQVPGPAPYNG